MLNELFGYFPDSDGFLRHCDKKRLYSNFMNFYRYLVIYSTPNPKVERRSNGSYKLAFQPIEEMSEECFIAIKELIVQVAKLCYETKMKLKSISKSDKDDLGEYIGINNKKEL